MKKIKINIPSQKLDLENKILKNKFKVDNKNIEDIENSNLNDESFKNVHIKPADEQEFEVNTQIDNEI